MSINDTIQRNSFWNSIPVRVAIHTTAWLCLLFYPFIFMNIDEATELFPKFLFSTGLLVVFYYVNAYVFIPRYLINRRSTVFIGVAVTSFIVLLAANYLFDHLYTMRYVHHERFHPLPPGIQLGAFNLEFKRMTSAFLSITMIFALSTSATITGEWLRREEQRKEIENEKLQTELAFLKAQVNPHFLFNMLNNIYTLAYKRSDATADAIMKLSHLMRYMIYESNVPYISLEKEVEYLQNYIELQRMRLSQNVDVIFDIEGEIDNKMIAPMLLVPFVENAFKHGVSYRETYPINILIRIKQEKWIYLEVENQINRTSSLNPDSDSGIGLQNIRRRLELLYQGKYDLDIKEDERTYKVSLLVDIS